VSNTLLEAYLITIFTPALNDLIYQLSLIATDNNLNDSEVKAVRSMIFRKVIRAGFGQLIHIFKCTDNNLVRQEKYLTTNSTSSIFFVANYYLGYHIQCDHDEHIRDFHSRIVEVQIPDYPKLKSLLRVARVETCCRLFYSQKPPHVDL
jgi:hypothetical protein